MFWNTFRISIALSQSYEQNNFSLFIDLMNAEVKSLNLSVYSFFESEYLLVLEVLALDPS